jgi:hypothetical protein
MARTRLETWLVRPDARPTDEIQADLMEPQPLPAVDGAWSSDKARKFAQVGLEALGYKVRSVNASPEKKLIAYVEAAKPKRKPRSARGKPVLK